MRRQDGRKDRLGFIQGEGGASQECLQESTVAVIVRGIFLLRHDGVETLYGLWQFEDGNWRLKQVRLMYSVLLYSVHT